MSTHVARRLWVCAFIVVASPAVALGHAGDDEDVKTSENPKDSILRLGKIEVRTNYDQVTLERKKLVRVNRLLMDGIDFGVNIVRERGAQKGEPLDWSRYPTTYYHPGSQVGAVLKRLNWFPGPLNTYWADARMPASLLGLGASMAGASNLPLGQLVGVWSEPPIACVHLGLGTLGRF